MTSKVDDELLLVLHEAGYGAGVLAEYFGVHKATIHRHKATLGLSHGVSGPQRRDRCARGHSMDDALEIRTGGGRACRKCKQRRDREWAKKRYWAERVRVES